MHAAVIRSRAGGAAVLLPLPRSILRPVVPEDRDLRVVRGTLPAV
jgi:hypothetical protein